MQPCENMGRHCWDAATRDIKDCWEHKKKLEEKNGSVFCLSFQKKPGLPTPGFVDSGLQN